MNNIDLRTDFTQQFNQALELKNISKPVLDKHVMKVFKKFYGWSADKDLIAGLDSNEIDYRRSQLFNGPGDLSKISKKYDELCYSLRDEFKKDDPDINVVESITKELKGIFPAVQETRMEQIKADLTLEKDTYDAAYVKALKKSEGFFKKMKDVTYRAFDFLEKNDLQVIQVNLNLDDFGEPVKKDGGMVKYYKKKHVDKVSLTDVSRCRRLAAPGVILSVNNPNGKDFKVVIQDTVVPDFGSLLGLGEEDNTLRITVGDKFLDHSQLIDFVNCLTIPGSKQFAVIDKSADQVNNTGYEMDR